MTPSEFEAAVADWCPYLVRFAISRGVRGPDADDVVQRALSAAARLWPSFRGVGRDGRPCTVKTWLCSFVWRRILDYRSWQARQVNRYRAVRDLSKVDGGARVAQTRAGFTPEQLHATAEDGRALARALDTLGETDREIFVRHHVDGESCVDIARDLEWPLEKVKGRLKRARRRLRDALPEFSDEFSKRPEPASLRPRDEAERRSGACRVHAEDAAELVDQAGLRRGPGDFPRPSVFVLRRE